MGRIADAPRRSRRRILTGLIAGSIAPAITTCGLIFGPPPRQFTLTAVADFPSGLPPVKWSLVVDEPTAARQIDTSRIALMNGPFRVEYYADVEWTDSAPAMVQLLLVQSFQNTGRLPVLAPTRQTLATDFLLLSNLRKFQVENQSPNNRLVGVQRVAAAGIVGVTRPVLRQDVIILVCQPPEADGRTGLVALCGMIVDDI